MAKFRADLGPEIASWDTADGGTQYLFANGPDHVLVTERIRIRDGRAWLLASEYWEMHPGLTLEIYSAAVRRSTFNRLPISRDDVLLWFYNTVITDLIPAEFHADFRPRSFGTVSRPKLRRGGAGK